MWRGHEMSLYIYTKYICHEWISRGYKDTIDGKIDDLFDSIPDGTEPPWLGNYEFHHAHRANLVAKNREFYAPKFGDLPFEPYIWPSA
jgi:hypothetical protein